MLFALKGALPVFLEFLAGGCPVPGPSGVQELTPSRDSLYRPGGHASL